MARIAAAATFPALPAGGHGWPGPGAGDAAARRLRSRRDQA